VVINDGAAIPDRQTMFADVQPPCRNSHPVLDKKAVVSIYCETTTVNDQPSNVCALTAKNFNLAIASNPE